MPKIKVSVILTVYNTEKYLPMCLDSVCNQTLKEIEIICIDDSSSDASLHILQSYAARDSRISIVCNEHNIGAGASRNLGMSLARGEYVSILDSDDDFQLDMLQKMYHKCLSTECDVCICGIRWLDENSGTYDFRLTDTIGYIPNYFLRKFHPFFYPIDVPNHIWRFFLPASFCRLYRRDFIEKHDLQFQNLQNCNDVFFGQISLVLAKRLAYIPDRLINYRFHRDGQISSQRGKQPLCIFEALKSIRKWLCEDALWDVYSKSFFEYAAESIWANMSASDVLTQNLALEFWKNTGLRSLRMQECKEDDFVTVMAYRKWCALQSGKRLAGSVDVLDDHSRYIRFFSEVANEQLSFALWGWGENGRKFFRIACRYQFSIMEVYDRDPDKWRTSTPKVVPYEKKNNKVNAVIVTNSKFMQDVCNTIREVDEKTVIFDFDLYCQYGVELGNCKDYL